MIKALNLQGLHPGDDLEGLKDCIKNAVCDCRRDYLYDPDSVAKSRIELDVDGDEHVMALDATDGVVEKKRLSDAVWYLITKCAYRRVLGIRGVALVSAFWDGDQLQIWIDFIKQPEQIFHLQRKINAREDSARKA